jgi:spermidine/putrescine ABC transporter ATP-binding subunit
MHHHEYFIVADNLTKQFGNVIAVKDVTIKIHEGEFFSLLGPSGCGKSTLLRLLGGFEYPDSGSISIAGEDITNLPPFRRQVNMVFQNYALFPHLNVAENIAYGIRRDKNISNNDLNTKVLDLLNLVKLVGLQERKVNELSGGQSQRVALARALAKNPKVLLLDEPLGALDKKLREQMQIELRELQKSVGITFVFVTHDQEEAMILSDRIAVLADGEILQIDTPQNLYNSPKNLDVATFIGTINLFSGCVRRTEKTSTIVETKHLGVVDVKNRNETDFRVGQDVYIAIRPEKVLLEYSETFKKVATCVVSNLESISYMGDRSHIQVTLANKKNPVTIAIQNDRPLNLSEAAVGSPIQFGWRSEDLLIFPK